MDVYICAEYRGIGRRDSLPELLVVPRTVTHQQALPLGSMLMEYRIEQLLGAGGFGITYLGFDTHLEKRVAIKEYFPASVAARTADASVVPLSSGQQEDYKWGKDRFVQEARALAKFSHANIVRVNRFFEAHGTAYMVMEYEDGESLKVLLARVRTLDETKLNAMIGPLLDGLAQIHAAGFLHRDIKPDNLIVRRNGTAVLIDFGAARQAAGSATQNLTAIVSPGFAPFEQYSAGSKQGPWSDIYALSAVLYFAVTGEKPPDALTRIKSDTTAPVLAAARARYTSGFIRAIEWGLDLEEERRPQTIGEWKRVLLGRSSVPATMPPARSVTRPVTIAPAAAAAPSATRPNAVVAPSAEQVFAPPARSGAPGEKPVRAAAGGEAAPPLEEPAAKSPSADEIATFKIEAPSPRRTRSESVQPPRYATRVLYLMAFLATIACSAFAFSIYRTHEAEDQASAAAMVLASRAQGAPVQGGAAVAGSAQARTPAGGQGTLAATAPDKSQGSGDPRVATAESAAKASTSDSASTPPRDPAAKQSADPALAPVADSAPAGSRPDALVGPEDEADTPEPGQSGAGSTQKGAGQTQAGRLQWVDNRFAKADVYHVGALDPKQLKAAFPRLAPYFAQIDTDNNGVVTKAEIKVFLHKSALAQQHTVK